MTARGPSRGPSQARQDGYGVVKVKVGIGDDAGRLAALRAAAGAEMAIRLDANGAWSVSEAAAALRALAPAGIELCEEPVHGLDELAEVSPRRAMSRWPWTRARPCRGRSIVASALPPVSKISRCGGITGTIEAAERARSAGYDVYLASTLDGPLGIAAALHAAAVDPPGPGLRPGHAVAVRQAPGGSGPAAGASVTAARGRAGRRARASGTGRVSADVERLQSTRSRSVPSAR